MTAQIAEIVSNYRIETNFRNVRRVIVQGGINDLLQGNRESIGRSYQRILETVLDIIPVLIIGILPFDPIRIRIDPSEVDSTNHQISEICLTHANCKFIQPMGRTMSPEMLSDGLHLKADGISSIGCKATRAASLIVEPHTSSTHWGQAGAARSAFARITDSSRTSRHVRKVPEADSRPFV